MGERQAFRAWERHLEEAIGVADAEAVVDRLEQHVTRPELEAALAAQSEQLTERLMGRLTGMWRRDLLLIMTGQFVALAGVLTAVT